MQASNFGGTFDQVFLWIFLCAFHRGCVSAFSIPWCKKVKTDQQLKSRGGGPLAEPLEAILVIFGRSFSIIFFCLKELGKIWKMTHFCAHVQYWSPWRSKNVEKRHPAPSNLTFLRITIDKNGFRRMKEECRRKRFSQNERRRANLQCVASKFLIFAWRGWGLSYDLSKFSDDFTPVFFLLWKTITKSPGNN